MLINVSASEITGVKRGEYDKLELRHPSNNSGTANVWMRYYLSSKGNHYVTRRDTRGNVHIISVADVDAAAERMQS